MGEFLLKRLLSGGGGGKAPDMGQVADPAQALSAAMPPQQPQPGFSAESGVPDPTQQNAMAHPASSFLDTLAKIQQAPHQWGQDMRHGALSALSRLFS